MARPRFNDGSRRRAISRSEMGSYPRRIRVPQLGGLDDSSGSGRRRIFAVVSRPIPTEAEGKTARRILIFDNHPESLRLVSKTGLDLEIDEAASRRTSIICGSILIAMVIGAMLWPLLW